MDLPLSISVSFYSSTSHTRLSVPTPPACLLILLIEEIAVVFPLHCRCTSGDGGKRCQREREARYPDETDKELIHKALCSRREVCTRIWLPVAQCTS